MAANHGLGGIVVLGCGALPVLPEGGVDWPLGDCDPGGTVWPLNTMRLLDPKRL